MGESLISDAPSGTNVSTLCHLVLKNAAEKLQLQLQLELQLPLFAIFNSIHCLSVFYIVHHGLLPSP